MVGLSCPVPESSFRQGGEISWKENKTRSSKSLLDVLKGLIDFHLRGCVLGAMVRTEYENPGSPSCPEIPHSRLAVTFLECDHSLELFLICSKLACLRRWESATTKESDSLGQDVPRQHCEPLGSQNNGPQCPGCPSVICNLCRA